MSELARTTSGNLRSVWIRRCAVLLGIVLLALAVRSLTGNFIRDHFDDPGWFQYGSYAVFDRQAVGMLDHAQPFFWIDDPTRTDQMVYPPGFPYLVAIVYWISGEHSPAVVQSVLIVLDSVSVLLIVGIGWAAFGWRTGVACGILAGISPLLALVGVTPTADAPTGWFVLAATLFSMLCARTPTFLYAALAGAMLGLACWFRVNPLFLFVAWSAAMVLFLRVAFRQRLKLAATVTCFTLLLISPVVIRNLVVFYPQVAPTGLNVGWNLLAGIGETDRAAEFGAPCCDEQMIEQDRQAMNLPPDVPLALNYPDGIRRDRDRGRRAIAIIEEHPIWFAGVMANRIWGHFKYFGRPVPNVGSPGFNVTAAKCLAPERQSGPLAIAVNGLGMVQSVWRYLALPLMLIGVWAAFRRNSVATWLLLVTVVYYIATLAIGHSEFRYGQPMQAILIVFAGVAVVWLIDLVRTRRDNSAPVATNE